MALSSNAKAWWIIFGLSLGPAVSNGYARFAYGLILPAMREDLGWNFTEAGWINTANAIGYLAGALLALSLISRLGARWLFIWGFVLTTVALLCSALAHQIWLMSFWRFLAGVGGAPVFIAGGALASGLFGDDKQKNALAIAVYFGGGGFGMVATAVVLPHLVEWYGNDIWPYAWLLLGVGSHIAFLPSYWAAIAAPEPRKPAETQGHRPSLPVLAMFPGLAAYFMFGVSYIIYITFLVAWMQGQGASALLVSTTWGVMGLMVIASPFLWSRVLAASEGGGAISLTSLATGTGILVPLIIPGAAGMLASAVLFGASFFMVPTSTTTFGRKNLPEPLWGPSLALFTTIFSIGQIVGPVGAGVVADYAGGPALGMAIGGCTLLLGAAIALLQRPLAATRAPV